MRPSLSPPRKTPDPVSVVLLVWAAGADMRVRNRLLLRVGAPWVPAMSAATVILAQVRPLGLLERLAQGLRQAVPLARRVAAQKALAKVMAGPVLLKVVAAIPVRCLVLARSLAG